MNSSRWPPCSLFDAARSAFGHQFAGHHEAEAIALLGFFQIVRGHEDRGAHIGKLVDHAPERAARERIDAGGGLVEKKDARLVHDRGAECDALFPAAGQAAGDLIAPCPSSPENASTQRFFSSSSFSRHAIDAGEEFEVLLDGEIVIQRELLGHVADALANAFGAEAARSRRPVPSSPVEGSSRPQSILMVVVLPAPFAPSSP